MNKVIRKIDQLMLILSGVGLITLMLLITAGVVTRYVFGYSIPTTYAIIENYLMPVTIFTAIGYTYKSGIFPRVDLFVNKLKSDRMKHYTHSAIICIELIVFICITYFLFQYVIYSIEDGIGFSANSINFPIYPVYILMFVSFLWLSFMILLKLIQSLKDKEADPYL